MDNNTDVKIWILRRKTKFQFLDYPYLIIFKLHIILIDVDDIVRVIDAKNGVWTVPIYCIEFGVTGHVRCQHKPVKGKGEQDEDLQKDADHRVFLRLLLLLRRLLKWQVDDLHDYCTIALTWNKTDQISCRVISIVLFYNIIERNIDLKIFQQEIVTAKTWNV